MMIMGREEIRAKRALEKNPIEACNEVQRRFYPKLFNKFGRIGNPRHPSYITYIGRTMLGQMYYKGISGIISMQDMTDKFSNSQVVENMAAFMGVKLDKYLPHHVTENDYLERLNPNELQDTIQDIVYTLIRRKSFDEAKFMGKWIIIIDGTQLYSGDRKINDKCLERHHNKGTEQETVNYHVDVLEAKIYLGSSLVCSICSEFIENNGEDAEKQKNMSEAEQKQDCELKAFKRMSEKLKKAFPRLPILLLMDSLYASKSVMDICRENKWDYIIRFKDGSIPYIAKEYEAIPEKEQLGNAEYINEIDYEGHKINLLKYREKAIEKREVKITTFQWITNLEITKKNALKIAKTGRLRWKIENEGFNRQKNWQADITHACSWNEWGLKNHYLIQQISDIMKQLYEHYVLKKLEIKKKQKNISSELLTSLARQLTEEDIFRRDTQSVSTN
jgi:hypothetical protein